MHFFRVVALALVLLISPGARAAADGPYEVVRPDGPGPHPAALLVPGCSGFASPRARPFYDDVAARLRARGHVVVFVDYLRPRGLTSCVETAAPIVAQELLAAARWLRTQPSVDPRRITAIGWSFGGGSTLFALGMHAAGELPFSRAIVYYPLCASVPWRANIPVLMLLAGDDDVTAPEPCEAAARAMGRASPVKVVRYAGALHGFDMSTLPARMPYYAGTMGHHPDAAAAAWREVEAFLAEAPR
ncbi:MAG TPA: dienelactone hydrolase family protein [Terriglobales bacterium]|nr:dienelactone hydrolase family protein [Terriglobales bacterium]